ncbi:MAG TPA: inositol monophosphatase [Patescibacteria group bacterium]|nr:inositol monophosphatase [Patescibacteria group bacterium]
MTQERLPQGNLEPKIEQWPLVEQNPDLKIAIQASVKAGTFLKNAFYSKDYEIRVNDDKSEYTPFDQQAEAIGINTIRDFEPDAVIMSEEISPNQDISGGDFWVIDGIDGTTNFSLRIPICNFTLAKAEAGKLKLGVVNDFLNGNVYYAIDGQGAYKNGEPMSTSSRPFDKCVITFAPLRDAHRGKWDKEKQAVTAVRNAMDEITDVSGRFHREFQSGALELAWVAEGKLDGYASSWTSPWDLSAGALLVREAGGIATNIYGEQWQPGYMGVIAGNQEVQPQMLSIIQKHFKE